MPIKDELERVIRAAQALQLDAPVTLYRIVGDRIELWTCHGGPYIYPPTQERTEGGLSSASQGETEGGSQDGDEAGLSLTAEKPAARSTRGSAQRQSTRRKEAGR